MSIFDGIKDVVVSKSGSYFEPGNYKVRIKAVKKQKSQAGKNMVWFIIETVVLMSDNPNIKVNGEYSQVIDTSGVMFLPNVKRFMAAVSGVNPASETINDEVEAYWKEVLGQYVPFNELCERVVGPANPFEGIELELKCSLTTTKEDKPFTLHLWQPREA